MQKVVKVIGISIVLSGVAVLATVLALSPHHQAKLTAAQWQALQYTVSSLTTNTSDGAMVQATVVVQAINSTTLTTLTDSPAQVDNALIKTFNDTASTIIDVSGGTAALAVRLQHSLTSFGQISHVYFSKLIIQ